MRPPRGSRDRATIAREFERYLAVHWRLHDHRLRPIARPFAAMCLRAPFWFGPLRVEGTPVVSVASHEDGGDVADDEMRDLAIHGEPISRSDQGHREQCTSIVIERRRALGWACGLAERLSDVPLDT